MYVGNHDGDDGRREVGRSIHWICVVAVMVRLSAVMIVGGGGRISILRYV